MKRQNKLLLTLCLLASASQPVNAIIIGATTYVNTKDKTLPPLTILEDMHNDLFNKAITYQQRDEIVKIAIALKAGIAAEDAHLFDGDNKEVQNYVREITTKQGAPLTGYKVRIKGIPGTHDCWCVAVCNSLLTRCKEAGLPTYNVECRHYKDASATGYAVTGKEVWESFVNTAHELLDFTDDKAFSMYPSLWVDLLDNNKDTIAYVCNSSLRIQDLLKLPGARGGRYAYFGSELVEMHMLHALTVLKDCPHIIMCTGGLHAQNINPILTKYFGYEAVCSVSNPVDNTQEKLFILDPINIPEYFAKLETILKKPSADASDKEKKG